MKTISLKMSPASWLLPRSDRLLVACFPKSGSTYLTKLLHAATGFPLRDLVVAFGDHEQDICERKLRRLRRQAVIQQHVKATHHNLALIKQHGIRPIVLVPRYLRHAGFARRSPACRGRALAHRLRPSRIRTARFRASHRLSDPRPLAVVFQLLHVVARGDLDARSLSAHL